jgi:hypothetical protein
VGYWLVISAGAGFESSRNDFGFDCFGGCSSSTGGEFHQVTKVVCRICSFTLIVYWPTGCPQGSCLCEAYKLSLTWLISKSIYATVSSVAVGVIHSPMDRFNRHCFRRLIDSNQKICMLPKGITSSRTLAFSPPLPECTSRLPLWLIEQQT